MAKEQIQSMFNVNNGGEDEDCIFKTMFRGMNYNGALVPMEDAQNMGRLEDNIMEIYTDYFSNTGTYEIKLMGRLGALEVSNKVEVAIISCEGLTVTAQTPTLQVGLEQDAISVKSIRPEFFALDNVKCASQVSFQFLGIFEAETGTKLGGYDNTTGEI